MPDTHEMVRSLDYKEEYERLIERYKIMNDENEKLRKALLNLALAIKY